MPSLGINFQTREIIGDDGAGIWTTGEFFGMKGSFIQARISSYCEREKSALLSATLSRDAVHFP